MDRYIICVTIGPVFFSAALYLTLSRIIIHYGPAHSRLTPKTISIGFMTADFIALVLQAVGGAIADTADSKVTSAQGTHLHGRWAEFSGPDFAGIYCRCFGLRVACPTRKEKWSL
jgi:hypothetical protein